MKRENAITVSGIIIFFLVGLAGGMKMEKDGKAILESKIELKTDNIQLQSDSIQTLNKRLQTSNEKRGRLFLALLYTDIEGREKQLDSLLIEIGKDN